MKRLTKARKPELQTTVFVFMPFPLVLITVRCLCVPGGWGCRGKTTCRNKHHTSSFIPAAVSAHIQHTTKGKRTTWPWNPQQNWLLSPGRWRISTSWKWMRSLVVFNLCFSQGLHPIKVNAAAHRKTFMIFWSWRKSAGDPPQVQKCAGLIYLRLG